MVKVVFCLPGKSYSREFLLAWTDLMTQVLSRGHQAMVSQNLSRSMCIANIRGSEYDVAMFIDPDIVFRPDDFFALLESPHEITAGLYLKEPTLASPEPAFEGVSIDVDGGEQYIKVEHAALGWLLVRNNVIESIPGHLFWGSSPVSEADAFCSNVINAGHEIYVDTKIRIGHRVEIII